MTRRGRIGWGAAAVLMLAVSLAGAAFAVSLERGGSIRIVVREKGCGGDNVSLSIPSTAVVAILPFLPGQLFREMPDEAAECARVASVFCDRLSGQPDFVLVDVRSEGESVLVEKKGDALVIFIDSEDELVRVSVPLWLVGRVASKAGSVSLCLGA
ncbi:MAG: hypothetical protein ABIH26_02835 [Candidatus Eisenbacteria bacterium]